MSLRPPLDMCPTHVKLIHTIYKPIYTIFTSFSFIWANTEREKGRGVTREEDVTGVSPKILPYLRRKMENKGKKRVFGSNL